MGGRRECAEINLNSACLNLRLSNHCNSSLSTSFSLFWVKALRSSLSSLSKMAYRHMRQQGMAYTIHYIQYTICTNMASTTVKGKMWSPQTCVGNVAGPLGCYPPCLYPKMKSPATIAQDQHSTVLAGAQWCFSLSWLSQTIQMPLCLSMNHICPQCICPISGAPFRATSHPPQ